MKILLSLLCCTLGALTMSPLASAEEPTQVYEIRQYVLGEEHSGDAVEEYLTGAMLPALKRNGASAVGVFAPADGETSKDRFLIVAYDSLEQVLATQKKLVTDQELATARQAFEAKTDGKAPYVRVESELLSAMDSMPKLESPQSVGTEDTRVYELRVYESVNESMGDRKVEMFNAGEVPIFLDCNISPVFLGQAIAGPYTPSLTYLTAYPSNQAREESWVAFRVHPDWKVLSAKERYQNTVSKIYKYVLKPVKGSEL